MNFWDEIGLNEKVFIEFLYLSGCLKVGKIGDFKLKSGRYTCYFIDMAESFDNKSLSILGESYAEKIMKNHPPGSFDALYGPAEKGTAIAVVTCAHLDDSYGRILTIWNRKIPKSYGEHKRECWIAGPYKGLIRLVDRKSLINYIMTDDVITTGRTKKDNMKLFQREVNMIRDELDKQEEVKVKCKEIVISVNRRELDEQGRNPMEVLEKKLKVPISSVTDPYNIFGHFCGKAEVAISKHQLSQFIEYQKQWGLEEDKERLEELESLL